MNQRWKIVDTDNFGGDYPDEKFINLPSMAFHHAHGIAERINAAFPEDNPRYYKAVPEDYTLQPGFEP